MQSRMDTTLVDVATKDLTGKALAWAVGKVLNRGVGLTHDPESGVTTVFKACDGKMLPFSPQDDWSQCGPLIHEYQINFIAGDRGRVGPDDLPPVQAWLTNGNHNSRPQPSDTYPMAACLAIVHEFGGMPGHRARVRRRYRQGARHPGTAVVSASASLRARPRAKERLV